jgi:hypothetical protein
MLHVRTAISGAIFVMVNGKSGHFKLKVYESIVYMVTMLISLNALSPPNANEVCFSQISEITS